MCTKQGLAGRETLSKTYQILIVYLSQTSSFDAMTPKHLLHFYGFNHILVSEKKGIAYNEHRNF